MVATVHRLHPQSSPIAGFLRVGHTGQHKLEALHAAGRLKFRRVVFDAAHIDEQVTLLRSLKESGCEIVLDPNFGEMSTPGKFATAVKKLPWANPDRPWEPSDFGLGRNSNTAKMLAEFAVSRGVSVILAPTNLIEAPDASWLLVNLRMCEALRRELDSAGASDIAVDYQFITSMASLRDPDTREQLSTGISDLPIENVWIRASGFGAKATGAGTRHFIEALREFHAMERPLVADFAGGFAALAAASLGGVGGFSHGVGQKESFRANDWKHIPSGGGGGTERRICVHELDRHFTEDQLNAIFEARGGRARLGCNDTNCCQNGPEDMIESPHIHFLTQRARQLQNLSSIPESRRSEHFMLHHLDPAIRSVRHLGRLKIEDDTIAKLVGDAKSRLIRFRDVVADMHTTAGDATRSLSPVFRGRGRPFSAVLGR